MIAYAAEITADATSSSVWLTVFLFIVQLLMGIVIAIIGFFARNIINSMRELTKEMREIAGELKDFQINIATNGVMREAFETYRKETRERLHDLGDKLGMAVGKITVLEAALIDAVRRIAVGEKRD